MGILKLIDNSTKHIYIFEAYPEGFDSFLDTEKLTPSFKERTKHYPERVLADQIYRTRENRGFCKLHGIRLSGPKLGRPSLMKQSAKEKQQEYQDNTD